MTGIQLAARGLVLALAALAAACSTFGDPLHREDDFKDSQRKFTQFVRWGNIQGATLYLVEEQQEEFLALAPQLSDVRFTDYEILRVDLEDDMKSATVDVIYTGYTLSSPIARTMRLHQIWKRDDEGDWKVTVALDPIRQALGLAAK